MNILVTGGAGFIGHHLIKRLLDNNHFVICVDNLLTGSFNNIVDFFENDNFQFIQKDIIDLNISDIKFPLHQIYNLACPASPQKYQEAPIHTIKANTSGVINVLNIAHFYKARILQASTSEIYGNPLVHPQPESYFGNINPIGTRSCYDEGKRMAETIFSDYRRSFNSDIRIARIFNTYGEGMQVDDGRVISNFIEQVLNNRNLTIYGNGEQTRSLCYISDLIEGLLLIMNASENYYEPFNVGNPTEIKIIKLAEKIIELTNSNSGFEFLKMPEDDPIRRKPDISRIKRELKWEPQISLEQGIEQILNHSK